MARRPKQSPRKQKSNRRDRQPRWQAWGVWALIVTGSIVATALLVGENIRAKWWVQDDHEIMLYLGTDQTTSLSELPHLLMGTEVGRPGGFTRYRPTYFTLRICETIIWGDSPRLWYGARLVMFAVSFALFWRVLARWIGIAPAGMVVLYCLTYRFWGDIWCRLGPAETYCVLGTAMFVVGVAAIVRYARSESQPSWRRTIGYWILLTAGAMLAMGSKENFLLMLLPTWAVVVLLLRTKRMSKIAGSFSALVTAYGVFIGICVVMAVSRSGVDVYSRSVSSGYRLSLAGHAFAQVFANISWWDLAPVAVLAGAAIFWRAHIRAFIAPFIRTAVIVVCLLLFYVSQFVFYNGQWPTGGMRYDFPGALVCPLYWVAVAALFMDMLRIARVRSNVVRFLQVAAVLVLAALVFNKGFAPIRKRCKLNVALTRGFTGLLDRAVDRLRKDPDRPVVVISYSIRDGEASVSIQRFLRAKGARNPLYLKLAWRRPRKKLTAVDESRIERITARSKNGGRGYLPLRQLPRNKICFAIGLSGRPPGRYISLGRLW